MPHKIKLLLFLLAWTLCLGLGAFAEDPIKTEKYFDPKLGKTIEVVAGEILVKFKPGVLSQSINALNAEKNVKVIKRLPALGVSVLSSNDPSVTVEELLKAYLEDPNIKDLIEYAEPNHICIALSTTPNDPELSKQWGLTNIKARQSWDIQKGSSTVIIAVVDSGMDLTHPDLTNRKMAGHDYVDDDNDPSDTYGHGTHVAGIIGAQANNSVGVAGVNWDCRIMPIRVLGTDGRGTSDDFAAGVDYARTNGAKVINMSLALDPAGTQNATLTTAINNARAAGLVVVAAAGNDGDTSIRYPGANPGVICVAATDQYDARASYSNANAFVSVCAPGGMGTGASLHSLERVYSTMPTYDVTMVTASGFYKNYDTMHGTSMATPFVSGFAGLIFAQHPTWTNTSVEAVIKSSVDHLGSGASGTRNDEFGFGRINMYKALNTTPPAPPTSPTSRQNNHQVLVGWAASSSANLGKYYIYRSTATGGPFTLVGSTDAVNVSYTDTVTQEITYFYEISAVDVGDLESALSAQTSVTISFAQPTPPSAPASQQNSHQVIVSWTASSATNVDKYYIYRSTLAGGPFTLVGSTAATALTFTDTVTQPGTYYYTVSAVNALGIESAQTAATSIIVTFAVADILIYPNPFVVTTGAALTFASLSGNETIRIYTISGELVFSTTLAGATTYNWNARNAGNKLVARGVYLYLITRPNGEKRVGKVAVIG